MGRENRFAEKSDPFENFAFFLARQIEKQEVVFSNAAFGRRDDEDALLARDRSDCRCREALWQIEASSAQTRSDFETAQHGKSAADSPRDGVGDERPFVMDRSPGSSAIRRVDPRRENTSREPIEGRNGFLASNPESFDCFRGRGERDPLEPSADFVAEIHKRNDAARAIENRERRRILLLARSGRARNIFENGKSRLAHDVEQRASTLQTERRAGEEVVLRRNVKEPSMGSIDTTAHRFNRRHRLREDEATSRLANRTNELRFDWSDPENDSALRDERFKHGVDRPVRPRKNRDLLRRAKDAGDRENAARRLPKSALSARGRRSEKRSLRVERVVRGAANRGELGMQQGGTVAREIDRLRRRGAGFVPRLGRQGIARARLRERQREFGRIGKRTPDDRALSRNDIHESARGEFAVRRLDRLSRDAKFPSERAQGRKSTAGSDVPAAKKLFEITGDLAREGLGRVAIEGNVHRPRLHSGRGRDSRLAVVFAACVASFFGIGGCGAPRPSQLAPPPASEAPGSVFTDSLRLALDAFSISEFTALLDRAIVSDLGLASAGPESAPRFRLDAVVASLPASTALVAYVPDPESDLIYSAVLSSHGTKIAALDAPGAALDAKRLERWARVPEETPFDLRAARELFQLLLRPWSNELRSAARLVVVPSGFLRGILFETLLIAGSEDVDQGEVPSLERRYDVSYEPTLGSRLIWSTPTPESTVLALVSPEVPGPRPPHVPALPEGALVFGDGFEPRERFRAALQFAQRGARGAILVASPADSPGALVELRTEFERAKRGGRKSDAWALRSVRRSAVDEGGAGPGLASRASLFGSPDVFFMR